jgi:hypothetical protein
LTLSTPKRNSAGVGESMTTGVVNTEQQHLKKPLNGAARRRTVWVPCVLALFFAAWALRNVGSTNVVDTDAARHAMNGAFIYDMVRTGHITHPIQYAREYYGHLPGTSMPYHPPLFPAIEALFFALFGVKLLAARLAVAVAAGASSVLLYRLILAREGSVAMAACVAVTTLSLWTFQLVATDVMLELPALAFTLAALYCLRDMDRGYPMSRALLFAGFAAAAVWTKQQAVFLGAVPVLYALFTRRWRLLAGMPMWTSSAVFGAAVLGLIRLSAPFNYAGISQVGAPKYAHFIFLRTVPAYASWIADDLRGLPGLFAVCAIGLWAWAVYKGGRQRLGLSFYLAWIIPVAGVLLVIRAVNGRYLLFMIPAAVAMGYVVLFRSCAYLLGKERSWWIPAGFAAAWFVAGLFCRPEFLRGPAEAAALTVQGTPTRILYAGEADGNFIFAVRALDAKFQTTVIPAAKLPPNMFESAAFEQFCREYGINWIVLEDVPRVAAWSSLRTASTASMQLERTIPLESNRHRWRGNLRVYRFASPSEHPGTLNLPVWKIGGSIEVKF